MDAMLFDTIFNMRAMRRLKADPVPDDLIETILRAGQAAPNAGNAQDAGVIVVKDPAVKRAVQVYYQRAYDAHLKSHYETRLREMPDGAERDALARQVAAVEYLTENFDKVPVWLVACLKVGPNGGHAMSGASIYPSVQNMLLAARALGLGANLTTRHMVYAKEVDEIFGLPEGVKSFAILPIGYPQGRFGPVRRAPLQSFVHLDRWGGEYEVKS